MYIKATSEFSVHAASMLMWH